MNDRELLPVEIFLQRFIAHKMGEDLASRVDLYYSRPRRDGDLFSARLRGSRVRLDFHVSPFAAGASPTTLRPTLIEIARACNELARGTTSATRIGRE